MERLADQLLGHPEVIAVDPPAAEGRPGAARSFARHTTREMLATETAILRVADAGRAAGVGVADPAAVEHALAGHSSLAEEQTAMVRQLTTSGAGVDVVVGKAGTGKSRALAAAREAWHASGIPVLGTAVAARTAIALAEGTGMPGITVARLLTELDGDRAAGRAGGHRHGLPPRVVLVVDEAGIVPTRQLARLLAATQAARGKLVLVGDHRQLPELAAGGAFAGLARRLGPAVLRENRRQAEPWERDALDQLRAGAAEPALRAYAAADRLSTAPNGEQQRETLVAGWWAVVPPL
ncbi:MAG TPA: AAA family ATPase [Mycobacteriales bacterium]|nr:AAA family ATPase [Mycobacteriales bacterium]